METLQNIFIALMLVGLVQLISCTARIGWELPTKIDQMLQTNNQKGE